MCVFFNFIPEKNKDTEFSVELKKYPNGKQHLRILRYYDIDSSSEKTKIEADVKINHRNIEGIDIEYMNKGIYIRPLSSLKKK